MANSLNEQYGNNGKDGQSQAENRPAERNAVEPAVDAGPNMGKSVTPHVQISPNEDWKFLSCGIDTLDLSFYVQWKVNWLGLMQDLNAGRDQAQIQNKPIFWRDTYLGPCLIYPTGKPPMYRFHLQLKEFHLYIGIGQCSETYPNVSVSLKAKTIWSLGAKEAIEKAQSLIAELGGQIEQIKVSRCDLCTDFQMAQPPHFDFLRHHGVPEKVFTAPIFKNCTLETYYIGAKKATIRARVYDKAKEVLHSRKLWFLDVWNITTCKDVWRVEFQLRRQAIKAYGIDTPNQLFNALGGIWNDLTHSWFSLRLQDNRNTSRRSFHPWWQAVQNCAQNFGPVINIKRDLTRYGNADAHYYLTRGANCLLGYAASVGLPDLDEALCEYSHAISKFWQEKDSFEEAYAVKSVELASPDQKGGDNEKPL